MQLLKQNWKNSIAIALAASLLAPLSSSAQDPPVTIEEEVEFVLDDDDVDVGVDVDRDRGDDARFTPQTERRERRVRRSRREGGDEEDQNFFEEFSSRAEIARERAGLSRREQQSLRQRAEAIRQRIERLSERDGSRDERKQLERELAHLQEQLAHSNHARPGNAWQPNVARQVASQSRRAHIQAAIASLRAAGLHEHAAKLIEELRESREVANQREMRERRSLHANGDPADGPWARRANPAPAAIWPPAPASQVENLRQQVESMHAEMSEIRQMLHRLMQRESEDRD